jgi:uncharacterized protein (UPF0332 family)
MKQEMRVLINYRLEQSDECLQAAELEWNAGLYQRYASTLYFACFYVVQALLLTKRLSAKTHQGAETLFSQHFVRERAVSIDLGRFYRDMLKLRLRTDYEPLFHVDPIAAEPWLRQARDFVTAVRALIDTAE